jgi:hypothetical protein
VATYNLEYVFEFVDVNGDTANVRIPSNQGDARTIAQLATTAGALGAAITACSNAKGIRTGVNILFTEAQLIVGTAPPTNAEYSSVTDGARLQFANGVGSRAAITIPAPLEADFGSSSNVVDSTNANIAALITAYAADASDKGGVAFNLYKGGIKVGKRARRRRSSLVP